MRLMMRVSIPNDPVSDPVKDGRLPKTVMAFVKKMKPEACYFTTYFGERTAFFVLDMKDSSLMPTAAEPFFTDLGAGVDFSPVMNLEEMRAGIQKALK